MNEEMSDRLDRFRRSVHTNLALGALADQELPVVDNEGNFPIVVALEDERLAVLMRRVSNVGGYATAFVDREASVQVLSFIDSSCSIDADAAEDLASDDARPGATATVGMFVDYLTMKPHGVRLPSKVDDPRPFVPAPKEVAFGIR